MRDPHASRLILAAGSLLAPNIAGPDASRLTVAPVGAKLRSFGGRRYDRGVQCPYCSGDSNVTETRVTVDGGMRRRRICAACKRRFTTYERLGPPGLKVAKRDGTVEPFELEKLLLALRRVCAHRPGINDATLQRVARDIEAKLVDGGRKSVAWSDLATHVLDRLANLDGVAARRFAANYTDEAGVVRFDLDAPEGASQQLGLPILSEEE